MPHFLRRAFPLIALGLLAGAIVWAVSFGTLPPAEFTFDNGTELETIDPCLATGQPENRVINGLFEGLLRNAPPENWRELAGPGKNVPLTAQPGMSDRYDISEDGKTYTFHMRQGAVWTDGTPVTAGDFEWAWMRMLHPETGSRYANLLYDYIAGGKEYNAAQVEPGGRVEVELADRRDPLQLFPRGTLLRGDLVAIDKPPEPQIAASASDEERADALVDWKRGWVYTVEIKTTAEPVDWNAPGKLRRFTKDPAAARVKSGATEVEKCLHVLPDFASTVGIKAASPDTFVVTLQNRTPYFADLVAFYPLYPVNRACYEQHGSPDWTRAENIVGNGPFRLEFRRIRDRIRLVKNDRYWDRANVRLNSVDALATKSETTALNMYLNGQIDWAAYLPAATIPVLRGEKFADQYHSAPMLTTYFYRVNVTRPELRDKRVRQALSLAIDKQAICDRVTKAGEVAATTYVPPGLAGYTSPAGAGYDPEKAKALLADAGYPGGRGLPAIEILYNDMDVHKTIAETIQQMWRSVGIVAELRGLEWGVYLDSTHNLDYDVSRAGWIADYSDPNTFLDMFMSGNANNQTGWSNTRYDELMRQAASQGDPPKRMALLAEAEALLLDEQPILPIYFYVSKNLVHLRVKGFFSSVQDEHPLKFLEVVK
jgi:oligopeptide transport system substrate-binding protein